MSWFSRTEEYSTENNGFYSEPEITYVSTEDDSSDSTLGSPESGRWDGYQYEYISSCWNNRSRQQIHSPLSFARKSQFLIGYMTRIYKFYHSWKKITIEFQRDEDMHRFVQAYRGTFLSHHPNYDGVVETDRILGSWTHLVHLERAHVKDLCILGEDVKLFNGKIRF